MGDEKSSSSDSMTETIGGTTVARNEVDTEYVFKIVVIGDYNVGKTTLVKRLIHTPSPNYCKNVQNINPKLYNNKINNQEIDAHNNKHEKEEKIDSEIIDSNNDNSSNKENVISVLHVEPTIGTDFYAKFIHHIRPHINIRLQFWDTAGLARYAALDHKTFHNTSLIVCVFDVTNRNSLEHIISQHLVQAAEYIPELEQDKIIVVGNKLDLLEDKVHAFKELLYNYRRHRRPEAAFLHSIATNSQDEENKPIMNHNITVKYNTTNNNNSNNNNNNNKKYINEYSKTNNSNNNNNDDDNNNNVNEGKHVAAATDSEDNNYDGKDDDDLINSESRAHNTNDTITTHIKSEQDEHQESQLEIEARNAVVTEKDVYDYLLNDFEDVKYINVSAMSCINMSRLLSLMCNMLLSQTTDLHHISNNSESEMQEDDNEINEEYQVEECTPMLIDNTEEQQEQENCTSNITSTSLNNNNNAVHAPIVEEVEIATVQSGPIAIVEECNDETVCNEYNVGCWRHTNVESIFSLSPQSHTATFVGSEDNLYSPREGNDYCNNNSNNNSNNVTSTSVSVSMTTSQLVASTLLQQSNDKMSTNNCDKQRNVQITNYNNDIHGNNNNNDNMTCKTCSVESDTVTQSNNQLVQNNNLTKNSNNNIDKMNVIQSTELLPSSTSLSLCNKQQSQSESQQRSSLLDEVAQEFEQQRMKDNKNSTINNNIDNNRDDDDDDGMALRQELRDRFAIIEEESRERCEANKTKRCNDRDEETTLVQDGVRSNV